MDIGNVFTGNGAINAKVEKALLKALMLDGNPVFKSVVSNPECDTLIVNDEYWGQLDGYIRDEINARVTVRPTNLVDKDKAYLLCRKDLEIDYFKHPFEPLW